MLAHIRPMRRAVATRKTSAAKIGLKRSNTVEHGQDYPRHA
jgi:hypothetical protein